MARILDRLQTEKSVVVLAAANSALWNLAGLVMSALGETEDSLIFLTAFNIVRGAIVAYAGWVAVHFERRNLWRAALAGALVLFVDHPIVTGGFFLLEGEVQAFLGVLISYAMFFWVAMLVAFLGGLVAKVRYTSRRV